MTKTTLDAKKCGEGADGRTRGKERRLWYPRRGMRCIGDAVAVQGRDGAFALFQPKTRADCDDFTCFGGRR